MLCACVMVFFNPTKPRPPTPETMSVRMTIPKATRFPMVQCFIKFVFVLEIIGQSPFRLSHNQRIARPPAGGPPQKSLKSPDAGQDASPPRKRHWNFTKPFRDVSEVVFFLATASGTAFWRPAGAETGFFASKCQFYPKFSSCRLEIDRRPDQLQSVFHAGQTFRMAHQEVAARQEFQRQLPHQRLLRGPVKIDHNVAAKNQVERTGKRIIPVQ